MTVETGIISDALGVVADAAARSDETLTLASRHLDRSLVDVLAILGFDKRYVSARGSYLYDADGRAYLDLHTGEGFASLGHNHPDVREVLEATLARDLVDGVQIHFSALAGLLAEALASRLPAALDAVFFTSTGAEAVDTAMKFARAAQTVIDASASARVMRWLGYHPPGGRFASFWRAIAAWNVRRVSTGSIGASVPLAIVTPVSRSESHA